jgi:hypothetical protein
MAVEILYGNIHELQHSDAGVIKLVYFGHKSEGQKKITRQVAEAIVLLLESNGLHIVNGLSEAVSLLQANGYGVIPPTDAPEAPVGPVEAPGDPTEGDADV